MSLGMKLTGRRQTGVFAGVVKPAVLVACGWLLLPVCRSADAQPAGASTPTAEASTLQAGWPGATAEAFVGSVVDADRAMRAWAPAQRKSFREAAYAEAQRRVAEAGDGLESLGPELPVLLSWAMKASGRAGLEQLVGPERLRLLVVGLVEGEGGAEGQGGVAVGIAERHGADFTAFAKPYLAAEWGARWSAMPDAEFVGAVQAGAATRERWPKALAAAYNEGVHAEAAFRVTGGDPRSMIDELPLLLPWAAAELGRDSLVELLGEQTVRGLTLELINERGVFTTLAGAGAAERFMAFAAPLLSGDQRSGLLEGFMGAPIDFAGVSYGRLKELEQRVELLATEGQQADALRAGQELVRRWAATRPPDTLPPTALVGALQRGVIAGRPRRSRSLEVTWSARLAAPRAGDYVFSISPQRVSFDDGRGEVVWQRVWVEVNGAPVLEAGPEEWPTESTPVRLTADPNTTIRVRTLIERGWSGVREIGVVLSWKGPGTPRQVTPPTAFMLPDEPAPGVLAVARWRPESGDDRTPLPIGADASAADTVEERAVLPAIDRVFLGTSLPADPGLEASYVQEALDRFLSPQALAGAIGPPTEDHPDGVTPLFSGLPDARPELWLASAGVEKRARVAEQLVNHPRVLATLPAADLKPLYSVLRFGNEREAVDVVGAWMTQNADLTPGLYGRPTDLFWRYRRPFRGMTIHLVAEHPECLEWLKDGYLEDEEGRCSLPVAYTVAYGRLTQGRVLEWIAELQERLDDPQLTGDRRVNWLLARAMAQEIRYSPAKRHDRTNERVLAGMEWIEEAILVAESAATKRRAQLERLARFTATRRFDAAEAMLADFAGGPTDGLATQVAEVREADERRWQAAKKRDKRLFLQELTKRRDEAEANGDEQAKESYEQAMSRLGELLD